MPDYLGARIARYVARYFKRHECWPTVREIARGLNTGVRLVYDEVEACGELPFMLTGVRFTDRGMHYVELLPVPE